MGILGFWAGPGFGQVQTFENDFAGWAAAAGAFSTIDFETLPDGSPSAAGTPITDVFNYIDQGAMFSSPADDLIIGGNVINGFDIRSSGAGLTHIRADLSIPAFSVGFTFGGDTTLDAFDLEGESIVSALFDGNGGPFFLGIVSDTPIAYVIMEEGFGAVIGDFHFASVPEPVTAGLLAVGGLGLLRRRGRPESRNRR
jgi:hypothetical protein